MDADFVRNRITQLRMEIGVSEYQMSYDLGHCKGYINNISSGKSLPSLTEFFAICDYCGVTPEEFFKYDVDNPKLLSSVISKLEKLSEEDLELTLKNIDRLLK